MRSSNTEYCNKNNLYFSQKSAAKKKQQPDIYILLQFSWGQSQTPKAAVLTYRESCNFWTACAGYTEPLSSEFIFAMIR